MPKNSKRSVSQADKELFEKVLSDVIPIERSSSSRDPYQETVKIPEQRSGLKFASENLNNQAKELSSPEPLFLNDFLPGRAPGLDRSTSTKMAKGQFKIQGRLDLHGMTQQKAYVALTDFIQGAYREKKRNLLVITGKGKRQERVDSDFFETTDGVLKRSVPIWMAEPPLRNLVVAFSTAKKAHGGTGALYVLLRRA